MTVLFFLPMWAHALSHQINPIELYLLCLSEGCHHQFPSKSQFLFLYKIKLCVVCIWDEMNSTCYMTKQKGCKFVFWRKWLWEIGEVGSKSSRQCQARHGCLFSLNLEICEWSLMKFQIVWLWQSNREETKKTEK